MSGGSSVYSPLPQSNSDSDELTEEELHSSSDRQRVVQQMLKFQKETSMEMISDGKKRKITNYKQLGNDRDIGTALNGFQLSSDEITVLKANSRIEKFSTTRKICFVFSIFLCIITIVVFLWILPCELGSCPPAPNLIASNSWKILLSGVELHGPINVVPLVGGRSHNLLFLYRNSLEARNETRTQMQGGGVMCLSGDNGRILWRVAPEGEPKDIDCNIIDVDLDGTNDCLLVGKNNLLEAIHPLSGKKLWDVFGNSAFHSKSCDLSFPIALPDLNGDHVSDLLTICSVTGRRREVSNPKNYFIFISGSNGMVIGNLTEVSRCYSIRNFMLDKENLVSYTCLDSANEESLKTVSLLEIVTNEGSSLAKKIQLNQTDPRTQHRIRDEEIVFSLEGRRLNLENAGRCPYDCNMLVTIKDERKEKKNETLWAMKSPSSFGMVPAVMKFEKFSGFVLKYWHWEADRENNLLNGSKLENSSVRGASAKMKKRSRRLNTSRSLELELFGETQQESAREKRMLSKSEWLREKQSDRGLIYDKENHIFHRIIERVVLIVFNETDSHSVNASQSEITQICKKRGDCQPDAFLQRRSLLIMDLDNDNYKELISYSSSFVASKEQESTSTDIGWHLQSVVQVIRLEAELPKLYDSKNQ